MALKNIVFNFPEVGHSIGSVFYARSKDLQLSCSDHSEEITGIAKFSEFWATASLDKSIKFYKLEWNTKTATKNFEIIHKKKISSIASNEDSLFIGDKTGEIWKISLKTLSSGTTDETQCSSFYYGHQAAISCLYCDNKYLISADVEHKIKVSAISEFGIIDFILLGHDREIVSVVFFSAKFFSCDAGGVLKRWNSETDVLSVKIPEPVKFSVFGEYLLGTSDNNTYFVDPWFLQVTPIKDFPVAVDYPHVVHITQDRVQDIQILPLDN